MNGYQYKGLSKNSNNVIFAALMKKPQLFDYSIMSIPDNILNEVKEYDSLVNELSRISHESLEEFMHIKEIQDMLEDESGITLKELMINSAPLVMPFDRLFEYSNIPIEMADNYSTDEVIKITLINLLSGFSLIFNSTITTPMISYLYENNLIHLLAVQEFTDIDESIIRQLTPSRKTVNHLKGTFEKLMHIKEQFLLILHAGITMLEDDNEAQEEYIFYNECYEAIEDNNYEQFKKAVLGIGVDTFRDIIAKLSPFFPILNIIKMDLKTIRSNPDIVNKYLSSNYINLPKFDSSLAMRMAIYTNSYALSIINNLQPEAKEAIDYCWEASDILWFKGIFEKWTKQECHLITNVEQKKKQEAKSDHLNVPFSRKTVKKLAEGLVIGSENPPLPCLVSSKDGDNDAINKLVYLFTGRADIPIKHPIIKPHNLVWKENYTLNNLKLLIYLLHFKGEFKDNDPLNALDDNDETSKDGISEVVKFENTGRRPVFPIVEKAFNTGIKSVQNAKKPKGGNREFLEQIVLFWWHCKNSD